MHALQAKILDPRIGTEFPLPQYATPGSAGLDLRAMLEQDIVIKPGETVLIPTGLSVYIGDPNLAAVHDVGPELGIGGGLPDPDVVAQVHAAVGDLEAGLYQPVEEGLDVRQRGGPELLRGLSPHALLDETH